jgi:hypothetical protein
MDMFGGLTKTSSRIAIAAALGLTLGGFAMKATPAKAADLGGDCCADLEERVAELEATTVRKGNKKVSVTLSGWVVKTMNWWDDGHDSSFFVGDKDADLASRFAITGSATIAPGWSGGYNITVAVPATVFGLGSNQINETSSAYTDGLGSEGLYTLYSYVYIKSDTFGTLNWGYLSPASDNPAVLADISGTVIESNAVEFEGGGFFLRNKGKGGAGFTADSLTAADFMICQGLSAGIGADCWGNPQPAVRYDSPTWGGFRFETSYGTNNLTPVGNTPDNNFWDIAGFYTGDWNSIKISLAGAYTWIESNAYGENDNLWQVGGSIMHKPSGLGIYGLGQWEQPDGRGTSGLGLTAVDLTSVGVGVPLLPAININLGVDWTGGGAPNFTVNAPDTNVWYVKPFWRKAWSPIGATVLYGEYGQYNDQFIAGQNLCTLTAGDGGNLGSFCADTPLTTGKIPLNPPGNVTLALNATSIPGDIFKGAFVTGSETQRWGLGVVQEIDSAAMHVFARWQHQEVDADILGVTVNNPASCSVGSATSSGGGALVTGDCSVSTKKIHQNFDPWDLFQVGAIIFF